MKEKKKFEFFKNLDFIFNLVLHGVSSFHKSFEQMLVEIFFLTTISVSLSVFSSCRVSFSSPPVFAFLVLNLSSHLK